MLIFSLPQATLLPLLDRDEPRFAEASREMLQSGNFIVPTFNNAPRYAKPPLIYWAQALSFTLFGENAFSARLPSLLAAAGTAALLVAWGAALGSADLGTIAALGYAFCFQAMQQGRVATADALLIFFVTLTGFAGWKLFLLATDQGAARRGWNLWGTIFALGLAGGFLAKGPEALLPFLALLVMLRRSGSRVLGSLAAIFLVGLLLVAAWAIPAYVETGGAYWREGLGHDVGDRMVSGLQGHGATSFGWYLLGLPLYLLLFWLSALPWSPLLLAHRRRLFSGWRPDATDACLLVNAALFFVVFSLMVTKLPHYTLPAFPFLSLLFARRWFSVDLPCALPGKLLTGFGFALAVCALILIPLVVLPFANPSPTGRLVQQAQHALTPDTEVALVDFQEPNAIWELRRVVDSYPGVISGADVPGFLEQPGPRAVLLTTGTWQKLRPTPIDPTWEISSARGWNAAKVSFVDLTLILKRSPIPASVVGL